MATRTFEWLGREGHFSILQVVDGLLEIFDFQSRSGSLIRRQPFRTDAGDGERVIAKRIFDPLSTHHFFRNSQAQDVLIKCTRPLHVGNGNADESEAVYLHRIFAALTAFSAASARSSAVINARPLSLSSCLPFFIFVPSSRTTNGTERCTVLAALIIPCAITSHCMIPPKILTKIASTFLSAIRILKASVTCSSVAPPPTSRKLAGLPP